MYNYVPTIECPNCGRMQLTHPDERHVYLCDWCDVEFFKSYHTDELIYVLKENTLLEALGLNE